MSWPREGDWAGWFGSASAEDAAWAVHLLLGGRIRRIDPGILRAALIEGFDLVPEIVDQSVDAVGDPALAMALIVDTLRTEAPAPAPCGLRSWMEQRLLPLARLEPAAQIDAIARWWPTADLVLLQVICRLVLGGTVRLPFAALRDALSAALGLPAEVITHRLLAPFAPTVADWERLIAPARGIPPSRRLAPVPEVLIDTPPADPSIPVTWALPGPTVQLVKRAGEVHLWADDARPRTAMFPEIAALAADLPDGTVFDGVLRPRAAARERLERQRLGPRQRATPVELQVTRIRAGRPGPFAPIEPLTGDPAALLAKARALGARGLRWIAPDADRVLPAPAQEVVATLVYLQAGPRLVASFALPVGDAWLPVAKAEVERGLYAWVKANAIERNGPVLVAPPVRRFRLIGALQAAPRRKAKLWLDAAEVIAETDAPPSALAELVGWLDG